MGRETALELARRGADVVVNYANSSDAAEILVKEIKALGRDAIAVKANVGSMMCSYNRISTTSDRLGNW